VSEHTATRGRAWAFVCVYQRKQNQLQCLYRANRVNSQYVPLSNHKNKSDVWNFRSVHHKTRTRT